MGFHIPGVQSEESRALEVLAAILWNGNASRFNEILRNGRSLITSGSGAVHGFGDLGFFEINLETLSPTEAASAALAELENIKRFGVSEEIVARAKTTLAVDYFRKLETVAGTAEQLAYFESLGDWKRLSIFLADVQKVTPQRVVDVTRRYLTSPNLSVFEYLPESVERYLTPAEYRVAVLDKVEGLVERRNVPELPVTAEIPQPRNALVADSVGTIQRRSILRGPDVYILEDRRLPTVSFGIFFPGGRLMETERQAGITELMLRTALRGTRNYSGQELARRIANAGVQLEVVNEPDFFGYALHGLAGRMDQAIQVLLDVLQNPLFEETEVLAERALHLARIQSASDDSEALSSSLFMRAVFGDHPYARNALGAEASISRLTGTQLREWFQQNQRKILPTIVIVGDARGTALIAPIADALTNEDIQSRDVLTAARPAAAPATGPSVETAVRQQSAMAYGFFGVNRSASERYAMDLAASLIAGRGLPNEGKVVNVTHSRGGVLRTSLAFPHEKEAEIRATLDAEFSKLRQGGITAGELNNAAQQAVGSRQASLQSRESRVLDYARAFYSGETLQSLARYEQAIRGVTMEQIRSVVERFLNPASLRIGMVRSAK
jgi:zinc protease